MRFEYLQLVESCDSLTAAQQCDTHRYGCWSQLSLLSLLSEKKCVPATAVKVNVGVTQSLCVDGR